MSTTQSHWPVATSNGGPLLLAPAECVDAWLGTDPPPDDRVIEAKFRWNPGAPPCDYDRACDVSDYLASLAVGDSQAVVLGDEPLSTEWRPAPNAGGGVLIRCRFSESEEHLQELLREMPMIEFEATECTVEAPSGLLALFDSAFPGRGFEAEGAGSWIEVPPGRYSLGIRAWTPSADCEFLLHHLAGS